MKTERKAPADSRKQIGGTGANGAKNEKKFAPMKSVPRTSSMVVRLKQVQTLIGLSRSSVYAKLARSSKYYDPTFPRPFKLGAAAIGWYEHEIDDWLRSREARRGSSHSLSGMLSV